MPQESTPCLPPCQCRKPKRTSAGKGTQANGEEALLYPAERFLRLGKTGSENGRDKKVNVILSLKCKEAHSRKKPGIALDAAGSA